MLGDMPAFLWSVEVSYIHSASLGCTCSKLKISWLGRLTWAHERL